MNIPTISSHISAGRFIANLPVNSRHTSSVRPSASPRYCCSARAIREFVAHTVHDQSHAAHPKGDDTHESDAPQARCARKASALCPGHDLDTGSAVPPCGRQGQIVELPVTVPWSDEGGGDTMMEAQCRAPTPPNPAPDPPFPIPPTPEPSPTPEPRPMPPV